MNPKLEKYLDECREKLQELVNSPLKSCSNLDDIPKNGIYVFYENKVALYVGRSYKRKKGMKDRIVTHGQDGSRHNSASFAFNIAREEYQKNEKDPNKRDAGRATLEKDKAFAELFSKAKKRVSQMQVRVVEIDKPILQALFEIYASVALGTTEHFNNFDTH